MEIEEKSPKKFIKVEAKKNLYKNNNALLNSSSNQMKDNIKKKFTKRPIIEQRKKDYINNDLTKKAVEYSNTKKLKKNLSYKYNNNNQFYENINNTQIDKDIQKENKIKKKINKKESYSIENNPLKLNLYNQNNNNYLQTSGKIENNDIFFNDEYKKFGLTERRQNYSIEPNNYNNSILNITVNNQIKTNPLFEKIKMPKIGHSIGIIEMIKNYNNENSSNKFKIEKYDKYKIEGITKKKDKKKKENDKNKKMNDFERKRIKCLNDQKEFDEPKNKTFIIKKNFSYQKKIFNIRNNSTNKTNKKRSNIKKNINYNENTEPILNKTLSLNNFEIKIPSLTTQENNYKYDQMLNGLYIKKENFLYKRYISSNSNNNNKKNNSFYKKMKNSKSINIKYDSVNNLNEINSDSNIEINNNKDHNTENNFLNKNKSELEIRQKNNIKSNSGIGSPMINTKMKNYRNQMFRENLDDDWNFYQTLPNISHSLKRNKSTSSRNSNHIKEIKINMGSSNSQNEQENINNKTNNYFYSGDNFPFLKELKIGNNLKEEEINKNTDYISNEEKMFNSTYNDDIQNKLMKTSSSININKKNLLYLKPKNKQNKNLKSIYYSNYNIKNIANEKVKKISSPKIDNILINNDDFRQSSLSKEKRKIYKKPMNKKNMNISKISPKVKENNNDGSSGKNYIEKKDNSNNNNYPNYNQDKYFKTLEDFNKACNDNKDNLEVLIKIKNKIGLIKKYYNHCIKIPISKKIELNRNQNLICYFTKMNVIKSKKKRNKNNDIINYNKIDQNELKLEKYKIKTEKGIKNDIIYLLNILAPKNILSIENQLTKLIMTSNHLLSIEKNEDNAKLFINDIIKNENIFIEILLNKIIYENKFNEVYSKLCSDLCNKYLNSINEIIINKFLDIRKNNDKYNIITNLKLQLNEKCISKLQNIINSDINNENKEKIIYLYNFIFLSLDYDIIKLETCDRIIDILFNELEKNINNKYDDYLDLIIYFILKLEKRDNLKDKEIIIGKITNIINNDININNIPNYLKNRINKFKSIFNIKENINKEEQSNIFEGIALLIKEDMENYFNFLKNKEIDLKSNINENIENQYNWPILKSLKKIDLEEIIKSYINICEYLLSNYEKVICFKSYIKYIIESISFKLSLNKMRTFHNEILQILANINNMCNQNKFMFEIIGYLLYLLIINELCDIKDINILINKEDESKIYICKVIKYTILSSERNIKNFYEEFKNLDLFKNCSIFEEYVTLELKDLLI